MHFEIADLRLFIHVAEAPSLTQGAHRAHLSPAATSARIKSLEHQLGIRLLYRDTRGVMLTPAGERLLQHARLIMRQVDYVKSEFSEYGEGAVGHIRIFADTTAITKFLPDVLVRFLVQRPGVTVDLQERLSRDIVRGVVDGSADLGLIAGPVEARGLEALHYATDRLVLTLPEGHPLAAEPSVTFPETLVYQYVCLHEGSTLYSFLQGLVERLGTTLPLRIQVSSYEVICKMIEAGVGIGILPVSVAEYYRRTMRLAIVELREPWAIRERSLLVREYDALAACVKELVGVLRQESWASAPGLTA